VARALTAEWSHVDPGDEPEAARRWRARRDHLAAVGCHHWVFRSPGTPTAFLEFIEGGSATVVASARERAGMAPAEILIEVELS
jgi:hypothetical protein